MPAIELAHIIEKLIIEHPTLSGLYHVAAAPINKHDLLHLLAEIYQKSITIIRDSKVTIDRSLNASLFNKATGYIAPSWSELIRRMNHFAYAP